MLPLFLTIDTEYSAGLYVHGGGRSWRDNFARSIACETRDGANVGIRYQMEIMARNGLRGVFFVDPMPVLVWGREAIAAVVEPIIEAGHDVQLHLHTEWLEFAIKNPLDGRTGTNLADFTFEEQIALLEFARHELIVAGAPPPVAFRAGNYGANDDTLRALARLGIRYDTSFPAGMDGSACGISLPSGEVFPQEHLGVIELPVSATAARRGGRRHAQLTALSAWELKAATRHAADAGWPAFVVVSHSFEMMNRQRGIANRIVQHRFESYCGWLAEQSDIGAATFRDAELMIGFTKSAPLVAADLLVHHPLREAMRIAEQALSNAVYG